MDIKTLLKSKRTVNIIIFFLIGICALVIGGGVSGRENSSAAEKPTAAAAENIEIRLAKILSTIKGAGKVEVFVSFEDYGISEFAKDTKQTVRADASESEQETVMAGKTGDLSPVTVKTTAPGIKGVIVSAKGAGNPAVRDKIKSAVETSLGVASHRVEVVEMK